MLNFSLVTPVKTRSGYHAGYLLIISGNTKENQAN